MHINVALAMLTHYKVNEQRDYNLNFVFNLLFLCENLVIS